MSKPSEPKSQLVAEPKTKSVTEAVKELRTHLGETQQSFAAKLKIAISTMVRYETNRPPRGEALVRFMKLAGAHNLMELERIFQSALEAELGRGVTRVIAPDRDIDLAQGEDEEVTALLNILRLDGPIYEKAREQWKRISEPIKDAYFRAGVREMQKRVEANRSRHSDLLKYLTPVEELVDAGRADQQILAAVPGATLDVIRVARQYADTRRMGSIFEEDK